MYLIRAPSVQSEPFSITCKLSKATLSRKYKVLKHGRPTGFTGNRGCPAVAWEAGEPEPEGPEEHPRELP